MKSQDQLHRYLFENVQVRGEIVQLNNSYASMLVNHNYPDIIQQMLGELLAATSLLTATLKFEGDITVQLQGDGPVRYIAINGSDQQNMRGVARYNEAPKSAKLSDVIGKGHLVITITPTQGERYQGIIALEHDTLAACLESYFTQSEQLATAIWLYTDIEKNCAGGLLLQALPSKESEDDKDFEHLVGLASTMTADEIFSLDAEDVLYRLFHQEDVRLFEPADVRFVCGCSREKSFNAIAGVNPSEIHSILDEQGEINVKCEYCLTDYIFTKTDLLDLLSGNETPQ